MWRPPILGVATLRSACEGQATQEKKQANADVSMGQAEEEELAALEAELQASGHAPCGEQPATGFEVATQEKEQAIAGPEQGETLPGVVSSEWTEEEEGEMSRLLAEHTGEDANCGFTPAKRSRLA